MNFYGVSIHLYEPSFKIRIASGAILEASENRGRRGGDGRWGGEEKGTWKACRLSLRKKNTLNNLYLIAYLKMKKKKRKYISSHNNTGTCIWPGLEKYW